jgi:hypothetical protein
MDRKTRLVGAAWLLAGALLCGGGEANAQPCGDLLSTPEEVFDTYADLIWVLLPLPEKECSKITKTAVAACHKAVDETASCIGGLFKNLGKIAKVGCDNDICQDEYETYIEIHQAQADEDEALSHLVCDDDFAVAMATLCLVGPAL